MGPIRSSAPAPRDLITLTMDSNKDEALKCFKIGKEALGAGDKVRAKRFLSKAQRLDPSLPVDGLLASAYDADSTEATSESPAETFEPQQQQQPNGGPSLRTRASASSSSDSSKAAYTEDQVEIVRQIKKQKDYYQILDLERECTVEDVRKAYRKLSLKVHPDKNKAPGAEEAFKAVSKAFQCLSNEESRKRYDVVGSEEPIHRPAARREAAYGFNGFYDEVDADEIFRNFFFGGMAPATQFGAYRFRTGGMGGARVHEVHGSGGSGVRMLIQALPVILLLLLNFMPSSDPPYTLSRSYPYDLKLETPRGVPFFVKSRKFEEEYPRNSAARMSLEERVEREYVSIVSQNCRLELQRQQWGFMTKTPHCDMLRKYEAAAAAS